MIWYWATSSHPIQITKSFQLAHSGWFRRRSYYSEPHFKALADLHMTHDGCNFPQAPLQNSASIQPRTSLRNFPSKKGPKQELHPFSDFRMGSDRIIRTHATCCREEVARSRVEELEQASEDYALQAPAARLRLPANRFYFLCRKVFEVQSYTM